VVRVAFHPQLDEQGEGKEEEEYSCYRHPPPRILHFCLTDVGNALIELMEHEGVDDPLDERR